MNFLLTISLFILLVVAVFASNFDLIHPAVIFSALWFMSSFLWMLTANQWQEYCSLTTYGFVMLGNCLCVAIMIRTSKLKIVFGNNFKRSRLHLNVDSTIVYYEFSKQRKRILIIGLIIFYIIATRMMFTRIGELAALASRYENSSNAVYLARISEINGIGFGMLYLNIMRINVALGIVLSKKTEDMISRKEKGAWIFIPFLLYSIFFSVIRGSRNDMMYILGAYLLIFIFSVYKNSTNRRKSSRKAFKYFVYFMLAIIVVWIISGIFFSRIGSSAIRSVIGYMGGPLAGLNYLFSHPDSIDSRYFGQNTFDSIYALLSRLGMLTFKRASVYLPYAGNQNFSINVYTMYGRYFSDFGYIGSIFLSIVFSCFFGTLYGKLVKSVGERREHLLTLTYATFMYPLLMSFFEDKFYSYINNTIYLLVFVLLIDKLILSEKKRVVKESGL